jgi:ribosomal protein L7/L12
MVVTPEQIATRAYGRFLERGGEHGHDVEDWIAAKEELERSVERYGLELVDAGARVIEVVRAIRDLTGMALRDVEDIVSAPPRMVLRESSAEGAQGLKARLEGLGARVVVRAGLGGSA